MNYKIIYLALLGTLAACGGGGSSSTATCADGWETHSAGKQGACSSHGGLASPNNSSTVTPSSPTTGSSNIVATAQALQITAKLNGIVVPGYPTTAASAPAVILSSGQELEVTFSTPTVFGSNLNGVVAAVRNSTLTTYKAVLAAAIDTTGSLTFTTTSSPSQTTTLPITVKAVQFQAVIPKVGDSFVYAENDTLVNKTAFRVGNVTQRVSAVNADSTWTETYLSPSNSLIGMATYTSQGNRTSFRNDASSTQSCNDKGNKLSRYTPEEKHLAFPMAVGAIFSGSWQATCGTDATVADSQDESMNARVVGYEAVTTAAGVFNALRIDQTTVVSNSTNTAFPGGGYRQSVSVWFDPVLGRNIKYSGTRTYANPPSTLQAAALVETTNIELVSYVKN